MPYYESPAINELQLRSESDEPKEEFSGRDRRSNVSSDNDEPEASTIGQDW